MGESKAVWGGFVVPCRLRWRLCLTFFLSCFRSWIEDLLNRETRGGKRCGKRRCYGLCCGGFRCCKKGWTCRYMNNIRRHTCIPWALIRRNLLIATSLWCHKGHAQWRLLQNDVYVSESFPNFTDENNLIYQCFQNLIFMKLQKTYIKYTILGRIALDGFKYWSFIFFLC